MILGWILVLFPLAVAVYAYVLYPAVIWLIARLRDLPLPTSDPPEWPELTILLPAYNEERVIRGALDALLLLDYPAGRRHILVVSDASTDGTDAIVRSYAEQGASLVRLPTRGGKTAAENAAGPWLRGDLVVSTDATTRIPGSSLKELVRVFADPTIGVASGRNLSVPAHTIESGSLMEATSSLSGEGAYVGYEMWLRSLETRAGSIVGASGCFYGVRRSLYEDHFPSGLSRDFAAALLAAERGFRAVLVPAAVCFVPRAAAVRVEFRRKLRTMARGLETLWFKRRLMNPRRFPLFAFMLMSHKLARWLALLLAPLVVVGFALLAPSAPWATAALVGILLFLLGGATAFAWPDHKRPPGIVSALGFAVGAAVAGVAAWSRALRGKSTPIWEPTRRR